MVYPSQPQLTLYFTLLLSAIYIVQAHGEIHRAFLRILKTQLMAIYPRLLASILSPPIIISSGGYHLLCLSILVPQLFCASLSSSLLPSFDIYHHLWAIASDQQYATLSLYTLHWHLSFVCLLSLVSDNLLLLPSPPPPSII